MLAGLVRRVLCVFFRGVEVTGHESVPTTGGGLVISWHPNALADAGLVLTHFPRPIVVGARHGLFRWPILGSVMRALGTIPIYRRQDTAPESGDQARRSANEKSLDELARSIAGGAFASLFPEGVSHDEPGPVGLKTGAARLYYRAVELTPAGSPPPVIIPVGLHYRHKRAFGSDVLIAFHPPLELPAELKKPTPDPDGEEARREQCRLLTAEIERVLHDVVHATASWDLHHAMHRARKLMRAERAHRAGATLARPNMQERVLGFARLWEGYRERVATHPDEVARLVLRVQSYHADLRALGLHDHELDSPPPLFASPWLALLIVLQVAFVYLLLPPLVLLGFVASAPAAVFVWGLSKYAAKARKDEATLKLLGGAVAFPIAWTGLALLVAWGQLGLSALYPTIPKAPVVSAMLAWLLSAIGTWVALHYQRLARQTLRSVRVRLTRARRSYTIRRLRVERARLYEALSGMAAGLALPGTVTPEGRVVDAPPDLP